MGAHQLLHLYSGIYLMTGTDITLRGREGRGDYAIHNVKCGALGDTSAPEIGHCYKVIWHMYPHSIAEINIQKIFSTAGNKLITYINYILYSCSYCCIKDENEKKKLSDTKYIWRNYYNIIITKLPKLPCFKKLMWLLAIRERQSQQMGKKQISALHPTAIKLKKKKKKTLLHTPLLD